MTREECTERIEQITRLLENFREEHVLAHKHTATMATLIMQYEQELKQLRLQQKPKYTAKDFPCLDWADEYGILYNDGIYQYQITNGLKRVSKGNLNENNVEASDIDFYLDIIECKLSNIKGGDYFAWFNNRTNISSYRFCTKIKDGEIYSDHGYDGYIHNDSTPSENRYEENVFVKFILKDK